MINYIIIMIIKFYPSEIRNLNCTYKSFIIRLRLYIVGHKVIYIAVFINYNIKVESTRMIFKEPKH